MAKTEFHGEQFPNGEDEERFVPQAVRVVGAFKVADVAVNSVGQIEFTSQGSRSTWSTATVRSLLYSLQEAVDFVESHPEKYQRAQRLLEREGILDGD